jgi:hypothetical protein
VEVFVWTYYKIKALVVLGLIVGVLIYVQITDDKKKGEQQPAQTGAPVRHTVAKTWSEEVKPGMSVKFQYDLAGPSGRFTGKWISTGVGDDAKGNALSLVRILDPRGEEVERWENSEEHTFYFEIPVPGAVVFEFSNQDTPDSASRKVTLNFKVE